MSRRDSTGRLGGLLAPWNRLRAARADLRAARARAEQLIGMANELSAAVGASQHGIAELSAKVDELGAGVAELGDRATAEHQRAMHALRFVRDDDTRAWERLWTLRRSDDYELAFSDPEPLVTIIITTYSNWRLMRERAIPSVLAQTYENFECIIVGDAAPPQAGEVVEDFDDPRLRFVNLPYRGPYPPDRPDAWLISGTTPFNTALAQARGRWTGSVSDDDALSPTYVESLLSLARAERAEVAYGQLRFRYPDAPDEVLGTFPPTFGTWGIQCSLIHACLRFLPLQHSDWVFSIPNDWSWAERLLRIGVRFAMVPEAMVDYFPSQRWNDRPVG